MARCSLRWESLSDRPAVGRRLGDPPALRMWMLVVPLQFPYIYLYACKVLTLIYIYISTLLFHRPALATAAIMFGPHPESWSSWSVSFVG